jgi:hypothetical protein
MALDVLPVLAPDDVVDVLHGDAVLESEGGLGDSTLGESCADRQHVSFGQLGLVMAFALQRGAVNDLVGFVLGGAGPAQVFSCPAADGPTAVRSLGSIIGWQAMPEFTGPAWDEDVNIPDAYLPVTMTLGIGPDSTFDAGFHDMADEVVQALVVRSSSSHVKVA